MLVEACGETKKNSKQTKTHNLSTHTVTREKGTIFKHITPVMIVIISSKIPTIRPLAP